jgi:hypothetical protein
MTVSKSSGIGNPLLYKSIIYQKSFLCSPPIGMAIKCKRFRGVYGVGWVCALMMRNFWFERYEIGHAQATT